MEVDQATTSQPDPSTTEGYWKFTKRPAAWSPEMSAKRATAMKNTAKSPDHATSTNAPNKQASHPNNNNTNVSSNKIINNNSNIINSNSNTNIINSNKINNNSNNNVINSNNNSNNSDNINRINSNSNSNTNSNSNNSNNNSSNSNKLNNTNSKQNKNITPLIVHGKLSNTNQVRELRKIIDNTLKSGWATKHTADTLIIYPQNEAEKCELATILAEKGLDHHTHKNKEDKTHAFVLRGLDHDPDPAEILLDLKELGVKILNIFRMKNTKNPLYLIITNKDHTLKELQEKIKFVCHTKISWERQHKKREIIQCRNCQLWGHGASNCRAKPNCLKCAEQHRTATCTKTTDTPATCYNCSGPHPANSLECPVYLKKVDTLKKNNNRKGQTIAPQTNNIKINRKPSTVRPDTQSPTEFWSQLQINNNTITPSQSTQMASQQTLLPSQLNTTTSLPNTGINEMNELVNEINKFQSMVNTTNLLRAIRDLNAAVSAAGNNSNLKGLTIATFNFAAYGI